MSWTHTLKRNAWLAAVLLVPALSVPAWAQTTGTGSTDNGTCEGMTGTATIAGKTYVSVGQVPIPSMSGYVYNRAECECKTRDLGMRIEMSTPIPMGTSGVGGELWVGAADCTAATARQTTGTICEKTNTAITVSSFMSIGTIDLAVPSETIPNPKPVNWMPTAETPTYPYSCNISGTSTRTFFVLLGDLTGSPASCKLPLAIDTSPPLQPQNISAANGDGAVTLHWEAPTGDNTQDIDSYQVLCRRKDSPMVPVKTTEFRQAARYYYSACINGAMYRRPPPTQTANLPAAPSDGIPTINSYEFPLHPAFICSDRLQVGTGGTSFNIRITDLENGVPYEFLVVAIDKSGNPSAPPDAECKPCDEMMMRTNPAECERRKNLAKCNQLVQGTPAPVVNPLAQFCQTDAECPTGFGCTLASPRRGTSPTPGWLALLGLGVALLPLRSRRRRPVSPSLSERRA